MDTSARTDDLPTGVSAIRNFVVIDGRRIGPLDAAALRAIELRSDSWIWRDGLNDWKRAGELADLHDALARSSTPSSPASPIGASTAVTSSSKTGA